MDELLCQKEGVLTCLRLSRPEKANALNRSLVESLLDAVTKCSQDGTRVLVVQGHGPSFCSGFDLSALEAESEGDTAVRFLRIETLLQAVYHAPCLTVALGHGRIFGAGADLFCACRWRALAPDTIFCMPGLRFGVVLGTRRLVHRIGQHAAQRLLLEARTFTAEEALRIGFATEEASQEEWPELIDRARDAAQVLSVDSAEALFRVSAPDTRAADMADLALSVSRPGLHARIRLYRESLRARQKK